MKRRNANKTHSHKKWNDEMESENEKMITKYKHEHNQCLHSAHTNTYKYEITLYLHHFCLTLPIIIFKCSRIALSGIVICTRKYVCLSFFSFYFPLIFLQSTNCCLHSSSQLMRKNQEPISQTTITVAVLN